MGGSATLVAPDKGTLPGREIFPDLGNVIAKPLPSIDSGVRDLKIVQTDNTNKFDSTTGSVSSNPNLGLQTDNTVLSPATSVDHEFDHAVDNVKNPEQHARNVATGDSEYGQKEERRVITGSEQKTAKANGGRQGNLPTRKNHRGTSVITNGVTSTQINNAKTQEFKKRHEQRIRENQWPD